MEKMDLREWFSSIPQKEIKTLKDRHRARKNDRWPIFEQASKYTTDPFWVQFLIECSLNNFPRGFTYGEQPCRHITVGRGMKAIQYNLPESTDGICEYTIALAQHYSIHSDQDQAERKLKEDSVQVNHDAWPRALQSKFRLLNEYAETKYAHLPEKRRTHIYLVLCGALTSRKITKRHVTMKNGRIIDIQGCQMKKDEFECILRSTPSKSKEAQREQVHQYYKNWVKEREKLFGTPLVPASAKFTTKT